MDNSENTTERLHAIVEGRVQGVGFRYFVRENAAALGLTGWVRNRWDDTVELTAEGRREQLERLLSFIHRGPRVAFVTQVKTDWQPASGEFKDFRVYPTA
jgi:acylphosphatase